MLGHGDLASLRKLPVPDSDLFIVQTHELEAAIQLQMDGSVLWRGVKEREW